MGFSNSSVEAEWKSINSSIYGPGLKRSKINKLVPPPPLSTVLPTVGYEVPDGPEEEPCDSVGHDEDKERAAPVEVHQRGEDVSQVAVSLPHVTVLHIAATVLLHIALSLTPSPGWWRDGVMGCHVREERRHNLVTEVWFRNTEIYKTEKLEILLLWKINTWVFFSNLETRLKTNLHRCLSFITLKFHETPFKIRRKLQKHTQGCLFKFLKKFWFWRYKSDCSQRTRVEWRHVERLEDKQRKVSGDKTT